MATLKTRVFSCPENKYRVKCPNPMKPTRIVIHNTANDASAEKEILYMLGNNKEVSFHYAVDDREAVQGIPLDRNAWHAGDGNGKGNREGIAVEICYSKSGGERWLKAVENAAELVAGLLKEYGWSTGRVTKHEDYSGKHCPHRILDEYGWENFLRLVQTKMGQTLPKAAEKISVTYQVWDNVKGGWLPDVTDLKDYAGLFGHAAGAVLASLSRGNIRYRVHTKNGRWLPEVKNREDYAGIKSKPFDGLMIKTDTDKTVRYAVHILGGGWLPFVTGYNEKDPKNGYAGIFGKTVDAVKMEIV